MFRFLIAFSLCFSAFLINPAIHAQKKSEVEKSEKAKSDEITLERLFPKKRFFGPSASDMAFSSDGNYAAWLYRGYDERRHGNDLWLYDFKADKLTRVTDVLAMSDFQRSARAVKADRIAKHKKESAKDDDKKSAPKKGKAKKESKQVKEKREREEERDIVLKVSDKDADDEEAPRYSGISGFEWHPQKNAMLVFTEGDIYEIKDVKKPKLNRLTNTEASESRVSYLPDGSGYTYSVDSVVYRVKFGQHMIDQLNPPLPNGEDLRSYSLSDDGKRIVIVGRSGGSSQGARKVDIIRYRDRFAKADSISRTVSDDETKPTDVHVYLFDLSKALTEESDLIEIFHNQEDDPRDVISTPRWSPDSSKVTFCFFDQTNSEAQLLTGGFPDDKALEELRKAATSQVKKSKDADDDESQSSSRNSRRSRGNTRKPLTLKHPAKVVYRFKHDGGPNTPRMISPDWAWDSEQIVFVSEQSGFRHVHLLDPLYESVKQLTQGYFEVYPLEFSKDHKRLFVTATKDSPAQTMAYALNLESGEMQRLSKQDGTYSSVAVSDNGKKLLANYVTYGALPELIRQTDRGKVKTMTSSHPEEAKKLTRWKPQFFDYPNRHGHTIHGMMFKPKGWKKNAKKKYPLLIYVYGGPLGTRKSVTDGSYRGDGYFFQGYMAAKHGYLTVVIDPRGQSGYGGLFEKSNYDQVGKPQVEDLVDGVKYLTENFAADKKRVGIHGWSFGGFQTQMCLYTEPDVFQVGMAGAGPTEWENYNSWYTTGTVGPSRKGEPDQKKYSLRPLAKNLKGQLLLVHGIEDTNVLFQDTVAVYRELLKAGKETHVELFVDPTGGHGLGGDVKTINRMRKYEDFLLRTLGSGVAKPRIP